MSGEGVVFYIELSVSNDTARRTVPFPVDRVVIQEDQQFGQRIRQYHVRFPAMYMCTADLI